jgi:hypothetical protein
VLNHGIVSTNVCHKSQQASVLGSKRPLYHQSKLHADHSDSEAPFSLINAMFQPNKPSAPVVHCSLCSVPCPFREAYNLRVRNFPRPFTHPVVIPYSLYMKDNRPSTRQLLTLKQIGN